MGPTGGSVNKLAFSQDGKSAFAVTSGGFYRSLDGGVKWLLIKADFPAAPVDLALDPVDPTRVYVVVPSWPSLYVSTDGGATLTPAVNLPTAVTQALQIVVSADGHTIYITSGSRIFRSVDRAQSWQVRGTISGDPAARFFKFIIDPTDASSLYATASTSANAEGVLASHDGGATWQALLSGPAPLSTNFAYDVAINASNPLQLWAARNDGVWTSADRGLTWSNSTPTPTTVIVEDRVNPAVLYAGTGYGQIYRTSDSGTLWLDVTGNISAGEVLSIAINPSRNSQLLVGGLAGVSGSQSSGTAWNVQQSGLISTAVSGFSADASTDRIYINIPSGGIYYTTAGATTTTSVNNSALAQLSAPPTSLYFSAMLAQADNIWVSQSSGLSHSTDGGNSWSQVQVAPMPSYQLFAIESAPSAPQTILASSSSALYRSINGGALWTQVTAGVPTGSISRLAIASAEPNVAYAYYYTTINGRTVNLGLYKSTDSGMSWLAANSTPETGPSGLLTVDPTAATVLYGSTDTALLKSVDSGMTWSALTWDGVASLGYPSALAIDPAHPKTLYASSQTRIARSVDGGSSWETLRDSSALPIWGPTAMIVDPNRPANVLVATSAWGVQQITIAPDLALRATALPNPVPIGVSSTFIYTVTNLRPFDATGITVTLRLPSNGQVVSAAIDGGFCAVTAALATCSTEILRTGSSTTIALNVRPSAAGSFSISGEVRGDQPDPNLQNNSTTTSNTVAPLAELSISGAGNDTALIGNSVSYTLTVKNGGPNPAPAASVSFQFAAGLTPGTVTSTGGACSIAMSVATCTLDNLPVAGSTTVTVNASAAVVGLQLSTAKVSSATADPTSANNSLRLSTSVSAVPPPPAQGKGGGGGFSILGLLLLVLTYSARWRSALFIRS